MKITLRIQNLTHLFKIKCFSLIQPKSFKCVGSSIVIAGLWMGSTGHAIQEKDYRIGLLAGDLMPQGSMSTIGHGIAYGAQLGYMFNDDLAFEFGYVSTSSIKGLVTSNEQFQINYYYKSFQSIYLSLLGNMTLVQNKLTYGTEDLTGGGVALGVGTGIDFDIGKNFVAGFFFIYNHATPVKVTATNGDEVKVVETSQVLMTRVAFVF